VTSATDRRGYVREFDYDGLGRRVEERWMDGVTAVHTFVYEFDAASQMTAASDDDSAYAYIYDGLGRITSVDNDGTAGGRRSRPRSTPPTILKTPTSTTPSAGSRESRRQASRAATPSPKNGSTSPTPRWASSTKSPATTTSPAPTWWPRPPGPTTTPTA
jgi:YD repeat-containing protein